MKIFASIQHRNIILKELTCMKKWIAMVLSLTFVLGLAGCGQKNQPEEKWDFIPMVMIDGILYLDTGKSNGDLLTSDVIEGEITSAVDSTQRPTENDQSNFGAGYDYRYGTQEDTAEILINGKWWIYRAEKDK